MAKDDVLPDVDHVVRYVKPSSIGEDGSINGSEFRLRPARPDDRGVSVSWMEFYDPPPDKQIVAIRSRARLTINKNGCYARVNVGRVRYHLQTEAQVSVTFVHDPLPAEQQKIEDCAHSLICGLPTGDSPEAEEVGDLIAQCVDEKYAAIAK